MEFLPTSVKEMKALGWDHIDVVLFTGDAYIDHPAFGAAVLGRTLQHAGYNVAIVPQPNWRDDLRDFRKFGAPRLFFGVTAGAMDSMVNHYTAARRLRSDDAYTPDGRHGMRPDYPTIVYSGILKDLFPDVPVVAGGIEASLRRLAHYDYWQDRLRPSLLADTKADMLQYGMGEKGIVELANRLAAGQHISDITDMPQTAIRVPLEQTPSQSDKNNLLLASYDECLRSKRAHARNFAAIERESNRMDGAVIWQPHPSFTVKINPTYPPMTTAEIDAAFDLPYNRLPHPRYCGKTIPAYETVKHSITLHRGCFGGCAFCTISAHQGKFISSRSTKSILNEVKKVTALPDFKGYLSDLGGPSANMYGMGGRDKTLCRQCRRPSCLHPKACPNLNADHGPLLELYKTVDALPGIKKSCIGSGVRYDLALHANHPSGIPYLRELVANHVSGRLKVAPEHTSPHVLNLMRKPPFSQYHEFARLFHYVNNQTGLRQQIIPYFISSHPGCSETDMAELAAQTKAEGLRLEQVQDFTPTPMTLATEMFYTGLDPHTLNPVYVARTPQQKQAQRQYFFWHDPQRHRDIIASLKRINRPDLIKKIFPAQPPTSNYNHGRTQLPGKMGRKNRP